MQQLSFDSKMCRRCFMDKPLAQFDNDRSKPDSHSGVCKACRRERHKNYVASQRDRIAQRRSAYQLMMDISRPRELTPVSAHLCSALVFVIEQLRAHQDALVRGTD